MELASQSRQGPAFLSGTGTLCPSLADDLREVGYGHDERCGWSKTNLSYSHKEGGEFESGLLPLKCGTKPPPMNKSAIGRDRTWPSVSPRDPAISVVRMEGILVDRSISRS